VPEVIERAMNSAAEADCLIAVGTSLQVYPVAGAVPTAKAAGATIIIVNAQPTPFDDIADVRLSQPISEVLPVMCCA
jgi:NAD-dependent deacetylase